MTALRIKQRASSCESAQSVHVLPPSLSAGGTQDTLQDAVTTKSPALQTCAHIASTGVSSRHSHSPGKRKHVLAAANVVSEQARRCIEKHQVKLAQELQKIVQQSCKSSTMSTAAEAGAGPAVRQVTATGSLLTEDSVGCEQPGLLSPPDSAPAACNSALQEFRKQPGQGCAGQLQAHLRAAEAKLQVHRTAAASAKVQMQRLEQLMMQQHSMHVWLQQQMAGQQEQMTDQQEKLKLQQQQLLQYERTLAWQYQIIQLQQQERKELHQQLTASEQKALHVPALMQEEQLTIQDAHASSQQQEASLKQQMQVEMDMSLQHEEQANLQHRQILQQSQLVLGPVKDTQQYLQQPGHQQIHTQQQPDQLPMEPLVVAVLQQEHAHQADTWPRQYQQSLQHPNQASMQHLYGLIGQQEQVPLHQQQGGLQPVPVAGLLSCDASSPQTVLTHGHEAVTAQTGASIVQSHQPVPSLPLELFPGAYTCVLDQVRRTLAGAPHQCIDGWSGQAKYYSTDSSGVSECGRQPAAESSMEGSDAPLGFHSTRSHLCCSTVSTTLSDSHKGTACPPECQLAPAEDAGSVYADGKKQQQGLQQAPQQHKQNSQAQQQEPQHVQGLMQPMQQQIQNHEELSQRHHPILQMAIKNLDSERSYILVEGGHSERGQGLSFNQQPSATEDDYSDWQVMLSSHMALHSAQNHSNTFLFRRVLDQLRPATLDPALSTADDVHEKNVLQSTEWERLIEYIYALAADNTVLSCEVFHLQQLLVQQRHVVDETCEAMGRKLAADAVILTHHSHNIEMQLASQQFTCEGTLQAAHGDLGGNAEAHSMQFDEQEPPAVQQPTRPAVVSTAEKLSQTIEDICAALRAGVSGMLQVNEECVKVKSPTLDSSGANDALELEQQLSSLDHAFESVMDGLRNRCALQASSIVGSSVTAAQTKSRSAGGCIPCSAKAFVTTPSGHVSLLPSRRTSAAQQGHSSRRQSGLYSSAQQDLQPSAPAGNGVAAQGTAATLLKRRSRLSEVFGGRHGPADITGGACDSGHRCIKSTGSGSSSTAKEGSGSAGPLPAAMASKLGLGLTKLVGSRGSGEPGFIAVKDQQDSTDRIGISQQQQREQQPAAQLNLERHGPEHNERDRRTTLAVLDEVANRLQTAVGHAAM